MNENAALWFVDRHVEQGLGDKVAFQEAWQGGRALTFSGLAEGSGKAASAFAHAGIHREERAAMFVLDQVEFPVIFWGALKAGIPPIAINTLLSTDVYQSILEDSRASIAFISAPLIETVMPAVLASDHLRKIVILDETLPSNAPDHAMTWAEFMAEATHQNAVSCSGDEVAFWLYSSGSTGTPKGVRHVHSALKFTADQFGEAVIGIKESDTVFSAAKLFFAYGLGNGMTFPLAVGATALLYNARPTPDAVTEILKAHQPDIYYGVPTLYAAMIQLWETSSTPDISPRICVSAGEALPAEIGRKWKDMVGTDIVDGVGSTEMLHIFLSNKPHDIEYGTSGTAVPGYEVKLVDENGDVVGANTVGELLVRGDSAAADYWNQRQKSRTTFEGEWTRTGDKYEMNENGRFIYCGRTDDMFKVSGIWVSPFEIEQAIVSFPPVLEVAVVAHRDDDGLEKPKAFVVLKDGQAEADLDGLKDFIKEKIGKWKYPRWVEVIDDLPKTATGKIQRFKLRQDS